jgi:hypothetical protein
MPAQLAVGRFPGNGYCRIDRTLTISGVSVKHRDRRAAPASPGPRGPGPEGPAATHGDDEEDVGDVDPHPDLPDDFDEDDAGRESIESLPESRYRDPSPDPDEPAA